MPVLGQVSQNAQRRRRQTAPDRQLKGEQKVGAGRDGLAATRAALTPMWSSNGTRTLSLKRISSVPSELAPRDRTSTGPPSHARCARPRPARSDPSRRGPLLHLGSTQPPSSPTHPRGVDRSMTDHGTTSGSPAVPWSSLVLAGCCRRICNGRNRLHEVTSDLSRDGDVTDSSCGG